MGRKLSFVAGMFVGATLAVLGWAGVHYGRVRAARSQLYTSLQDSAPPDLPDVHSLPAAITPDPNWTFKDLGGNDHRLSDFHGEIVFLNLWATWCNDCEAELSYIQRLRSKVAGDPVAIVLISAEDRATIQKFVATRDVTLPVYIGVTKPPSALETYGLPTTFILDPNGRLVYQHVGAARWDSERVAKFLRALARPGAAREEGALGDPAQLHTTPLRGVVHVSRKEPVFRLSN